MKVVSITEVRQDATKIIRHAQENAEPVLIVQRSRPAAYVVGAAQYEALQTELKALRRENFLLEVQKAEEEIRRGELPVYDSVEALMASIDAEDALALPAESSTPSDSAIHRGRSAAE
jgi:prevent-host-death family protein